MTAEQNQYYALGTPESGAGGRPAAPARARGRVMVAGGLAVLAAGLTVAAMFLGYLNYTATSEGEIVYSQDWNPWGVTVSVPGDSSNLPTGEEGAVPLYGIALLLVAVSLLVGAMLAVLAGTPRAGRAKFVAARVAAVVYCSVTVITQLMLSLSMISYLTFAKQVEDQEEGNLVYSLDVGYWMLLGMTVIAVVAAVLTWIPDRRRNTGPGTPPDTVGYQRPVAAHPYQEYQQYAQYQQYPHYQQPQEYSPYQQPQAPPGAVPPEGYGQQYPPQ